MSSARRPPLHPSLRPHRMVANQRLSDLANMSRVPARAIVMANPGRALMRLGSGEVVFASLSEGEIIGIPSSLVTSNTYAGMTAGAMNALGAPVGVPTQVTMQLPPSLRMPLVTLVASVEMPGDVRGHDLLPKDVPTLPRKSWTYVRIGDRVAIVVAPNFVIDAAALQETSTLGTRSLAAIRVIGGWEIPSDWIHISYDPAVPSQVPIGVAGPSQTADPNRCYGTKTNGPFLRER